MANLQFPTSTAQKVANIWNSNQAILDEGTSFIATNPTPNTVIATTTSVVDAGNAGATSAQTRPVLIVYNSWAPSDPGARTIYPTHLSMMLSQIPTSATFWDMAMWMEPIGASAYTSGGSAIVPVPANPGISATSRAKIFFGAITAAATTAGGFLVAHRKIDSLIPVTLDEWLFTFGDFGMSTNVLSAGATVKRVNFPLPALAIPPGYALKMGMYGTANAAAPSWEFDMAFVERQSS